MILYFSGTGNSAYTAKYIAERTGHQTLNLTDLLKDADRKSFVSETPWVIVVPTYAWQIPRLVRDWLLNAEFEGSKDVYFVMTCGDGIGNADKYNHLLCKEKGWNYRGTAKVVMPENYIAMFNAPDLETSRRIITVAERSMAKAAASIAAGEVLAKETVTAKDKILSGFVNNGFYQFYVSAKKFYTKDQCTGCGLCEKLCPLSNISLKDSRPVWGDACTHCMACICICPVEAIEYGKTSVGKVRYLCPEKE